MYVCNLRVLNMILKGYSSSGSGCNGVVIVYKWK